MAWYFLAGFISGIVGTFLLLAYIAKKLEVEKKNENG